MKSLLLAVLFSTACATASGPRPINVHAVRVDIQQTIGDDRKITSMGKVTAESAVVYTQTPAGRREETWNKGPTGWALQESHDVAAR